MAIHKVRRVHRRIARNASRIKKYYYRKRQHLTQIHQFIKSMGEFEWKHKNLIFLIVSIVVAYILLKTPQVYVYIKSIGELNYLGVFLAGTLFPYALTTAPATAALYILGKSVYNPFVMALVGTVGAVISDYLIFRFVRNNLLKELYLTEKEILGKRVKIRLNPNGLAVKFIPILAGIIIASPFPDELGIALFGATKIRTREFIQYAFLFHFIGIFIIASLAVASV